MVFGYNESACESGWCKIYDDNGRDQYYKVKIEIKVEPIRSFSKVAIKLPKHNWGVAYLTLCEVEIFAAGIPFFIDIVRIDMNIYYSFRILKEYKSDCSPTNLAK